MNAFEQVGQAVAEARRMQNAVDSHAEAMASLLVGRLQSSKVCYSTLRQLKNELRRYNPHTRTWRNK